MVAWRASKPDRFLHCLINGMLPTGNTRSRAAGKIEVRTPDTRNLAVWNIAVIWNALPDLRVAKSEWKAKKIVQKFVKALPV